MADGQEGLRNVGMMTKGQLNQILAKFPTAVEIVRGNVTISVKYKERLILSAAALGDKWHVRAMPGLLEAK